MYISISSTDILIDAYSVVSRWLFFSLFQTIYGKTKVLLAESPAVNICCRAFVAILNVGGSFIFSECVKNLGAVFNSLLKIT